MTKRILYTLIAYLVGMNVVFAQDLVKQANSEYEKDHYEKAIELYEKAAKQKHIKAMVELAEQHCQFALSPWQSWRSHLELRACLKARP